MKKLWLKKFIALIYLNDQSLDFSGGRFIFEASEVGKLSQTQYVEPRAGRLGMVEELFKKKLIWMNKFNNDLIIVINSQPK